MIDPIGMVLLLGSCAVSFGLGKLFMHLRRQKQQAAQDQALATAERLRREQPPEPPSANKSKLKRQLREQAKNASRR